MKLTANNCLLRKFYKAKKQRNIQIDNLEMNELNDRVDEMFLRNDSFIQDKAMFISPLLLSILHHVSHEACPGRDPGFLWESQ